jgi:hypothetical protein
MVRSARLSFGFIFLLGASGMGIGCFGSPVAGLLGDSSGGRAATHDEPDDSRDAGYDAAYEAMAPLSAPIADAALPEPEPCTVAAAARPCTLPSQVQCTGHGRSGGAQICVAHDGGAVWGPCECLEVMTLPASTGDCVAVTCPWFTPYPRGCSLTFEGDDQRGCVARATDPSTLYLKEGNSCSAGRVRGKVYCAREPGPPLDMRNCPMNKPSPRYVDSPDRCPD